MGILKFHSTPSIASDNIQSNRFPRANTKTLLALEDLHWQGLAVLHFVHLSCPLRFEVREQE